MNALTFDPLQYTKGAVIIGIPREHAEYQAEALAGLIKNDLVTKDDLKQAVNELKLEIISISVEFNKSLRNTVFSLIGAMAGIQALFHFIK